MKNELPEDAIDRLVRQLLKSGEEQVDVQAFVDRLNEARRRRRRRVRLLHLGPRLAAAAAGLLVAVGLWLLLPSHPAQPPTPEERARPLREEMLATAVREDVGAAWRGASNVWSAAVSAGKDPVMLLADAGMDFTRQAGRARGLLDEVSVLAGRTGSRASAALRGIVDKTGLPLLPEEAIQ